MGARPRWQADTRHARTIILGWTPNRVPRAVLVARHLWPASRWNCRLLWLTFAAMAASGWVPCWPPSAARAQRSERGPTGAVKYLAIGGGATPESTEVSLEQNLALAERVFAGPGWLLFAGGTGSRSVRLQDDKPPRDPLLVQVGDLFNPRSGRRSIYRVTQLRARAATLSAVEGALVNALEAGRSPLLVFVTAHGQQGEEARDNAVALWGGEALSAARLAQLHDAHPRPLRVVSASCFSGGFAELAFKAADPRQGTTRSPRCGLFAGTWDRETSGCDPDPVRGNQEGYSLHFLQALAGRDRNGKLLAPATLDLDADGRVSLLEAHARATIAAHSIDVPTTTSQRYLRSVQQRPAAPDFSLLPEDAAVIKALGARLGLSNQRAVEQRSLALGQRLADVAGQLDRAEQGLQAPYAALSGRLLASWPELDDAYHPNFASTLASDRQAIAQAMDDWPEAKRYRAAQRAHQRIDAEYQRVEVDEALVMRLQRAYETAALASALRARGGGEWLEYQKMLACERYVPTE
jgi:hypothetical protein